MAVVVALPRPLQAVALAFWVLVTTVAYNFAGMAPMRALLVAIATIGPCGLALWAASKAREAGWRDAAREDAWRLAQWLAVAVACLFALPAILFPALAVVILAVHLLVAGPIGLFT